jgi:uncharacterized protein YuzE
MKLQISYYPSDDILLLENGKQWMSGANVAEDVVTYADAERNPVAIEISGAKKVLGPVLNVDKIKTATQCSAAFGVRPNEDDIDRVALPLTVIYDGGTDTLTLECGLPMIYEQAIADGLLALYDGEDEYGKFINGIRLENAAKLLKPYLAP